MSTPSAASFRRRDLALDRVGHLVHARRPRPARQAPRRPAPAARSDTSITAAGWPSAAARFTTRPPASRFSAAVAEVEALDQRQDLADARGRRAQVGERDLDVELPRVGQHRPVLHAREVLAAQHVGHAGDGDEDVAALGGVQRRHHLEALHPRLQRAQRIDLADDHRRAEAVRAQRDPATGPAVAEHDHGLPRQQQVGRAHDAVEHRLPGAEAIVERALGARLVDRDDRDREATLGLQRAQAHQARWSSPRSRRASRPAGPAAPRAARPADRRRRPA